MNIHTFHTAALGAMLTVALSGCGPLRSGGSTQAYEATLSSGQEVPPVAGSGTGTAEMLLNTSTNALRWKVTYSGLSGPVTGAHIHGPAPQGQNAGVAVPFSGDLNVQPVAGEAQLTPAQASALATGQMYVNLHTSRHPGGEIRGQLRPRR